MKIKNYIKRLRLLLKFSLMRLKSKFLHETQCLPVEKQPEVVVFISSLNTLYPLKLTIDSLLKNTSYKNKTILVADNASTDGSLEFLRDLASKKIITLHSHDKPMPHSYWVNWAFRSAKSKYVFFVDSDILFLGKDWLSDMIARFESDPKIGILSGEPKPMFLNYVEPVSGETVDNGEAPCTWLFAIRTELREQIPTLFDFVKVGTNPETGNTLIYDTGGLFLRDMLAKGYLHEIMPVWYQNKWYHFGSLSWYSNVKSSQDYLDFKEMQLSEIRRLASKISTLKRH